MLAHRPRASFAEQIDKRLDGDVVGVGEQRMTVPVDDG
jgi:hypothetical protein